MSMTKEEAVEILENGGWWESLIPVTTIEGRIEEGKLYEALDLALSALRPITREQVEKVWRGEWMFPIFADQKDANDLRCQCSECGSIETPLARHRFCPSCGAPMTDEAVDIRLKELEALKDGKGD